MIRHELAFEHIRFGNWWAKIVWSIRMKIKYNIDTSYPDYYWLWNYTKNQPLLFDKSLPQWVDFTLRPRKWTYDLEEEEWIESQVEEFRTKNVEVALNFFFQSSLIIRGIEKEVCDFFEFKQEVIDRIKNKYDKVFSKPVIIIGCARTMVVGYSCKRYGNRKFKFFLGTSPHEFKFESG